MLKLRLIFILFLLGMFLPYGKGETSKEIASSKNVGIIKRIDSLLLASENLTNSPERMLFLSMKADSLSKKFAYPYGMISSSYNIARAMFYQSRLKESYKLLDSLLIAIESDSAAISKVMNYQVGRSKIYSLMAIIFQELDEYERSMDYYFKALKLIEKGGQSYDVALIYKGLGGLNLKAGNFGKANEYFNKALIASNKFADPQIKFDIYQEQYEYFKNRKEYSKALEFSVKMIGLSKTAEIPYMTAIALKNSGEIYYLLDEPSLAKAYLYEVIHNESYEEFPNVLSECYAILARLFFDESEYAEAEGYAQKAYEKAFNTSRLSLKANALYELAKSQQAIGKFSEAFDHLKLHLLYKDSLNNINNTHKILQIYSKAELDKVMTEKKLLENQLTIKMLESSRKGHLLIGSILIILLLSSLALIMVKKYKFEKEVNKKLERQQAIINEQELIIEKEKENQLKIELEHKNRELITHTMLLTQMHEDKVKLIDELQEIYSKVSKVDKDSASVIAGRINALRNSINANTWEDFKTYFENVYTDFYSNLLAAYPNLTPNEKKLCALLRLNLNTKEIAAITSREVRSIESARTRLRKKLGLSPDTNLSIFLSKF